MLGVILWSDPDDRKAVIWCEDQGDLAFLNAPEGFDDPDAFFDAGDVVQFDMDVDCSIRRAQNPKLVVEQIARSLPDQLRDSSTMQQTDPETSASVIPFAVRNHGRPGARNKIPIASGG